MVVLDKTEREIVKLLQKDGRMSFVDMAEHIGVTEGTIRRKFYRLLDEGIIKIAAVTNPFEVGFNAPAIIGLNVDQSRIREIVEKLTALPHVHLVVMTTGIYDIIVYAFFADNRELAEFLLEDLSKIEGITNTQTSLVLEIYKQDFEIGLPQRQEEGRRRRRRSTSTA
ncbi:MAG TPA: Lrp/AsnC family transcriptional regulator [Thermaerobacter sp.]|nr:MAG: Lrp/AsnC family transcriptional regulator [Bacillota bacterium]